MDTLCPRSAEADFNEANTLANVSNVSFAIGGVGAIVGIVGWVVGGEDSATGLMVGPTTIGWRGKL